MSDSMRSCRTCGESKALEIFPRDRGSYRLDCRPCYNAYAYRIAAALPDEKKKAAKESRRKCAEEWAKRNQEKRRESALAYAKRNREKIAAYSSQWSRKNRDKKRAYLSDYRAKKFNASVKWDVELSDLVFREAHHLAHMRQQHFGIPWHVDHIVPLKSNVVCGLHVWTNLQVVPALVNRRKSNKLVARGAEKGWL